MWAILALQHEPPRTARKESILKVADVILSILYTVKKDNHSLAITELSWKRKFKWDFAVFSANSQEQIDHGAISKEMAASALLEKRLMISLSARLSPHD